MVERGELAALDDSVDLIEHVLKAQAGNRLGLGAPLQRVTLERGGRDRVAEQLVDLGRLSDRAVIRGGARDSHSQVVGGAHIDMSCVGAKKALQLLPRGRHEGIGVGCEQDARIFDTGLAQHIEHDADALQCHGAFARARPALDEGWPTGVDSPGDESLLLGAQLEQESEQIALFKAQEVVNTVHGEAGLIDDAIEVGVHRHIEDAIAHDVRNVGRDQIIDGATGAQDSPIVLGNAQTCQQIIVDEDGESSRVVTFPSHSGAARLWLRHEQVVEVV